MMVKPLGNGVFTAILWWRNLEVNIYLYSCHNITKDLASEVRMRGASPELPLALIPHNLVSSPLEILQGAIHYALYSHKIKRIRNRGLALALLITGIRQLEKLVSALEEELKRGTSYYVVGVNTDLRNKDCCAPLENLDTSRMPQRLAKNIELLFLLL